MDTWREDRDRALGFIQSLVDEVTMCDRFRSQMADLRSGLNLLICEFKQEGKHDEADRLIASLQRANWMDEAGFWKLS